VKAEAATDLPRVSVVIVSYNACGDLHDCLASLARRVSLPHEILVVDNGSSDGSPAMVRRDYPGVRLIENAENLGFAAANNRGLTKARAPYALILNSDAEVQAGAVEAMAGLLDARPGVAIVGPRTLNPDGTPQVSFGPALTPFAEWRQRRRVRAVQARHPATLRALDAETRHEANPFWVSGSCFLARREALAAVGGFDEGFFLYEEDVDLCLRVRAAGWQIVFTPEAAVCHRLGASMRHDRFRARLEYHRSHLRYYRKHLGPLWAGLLRGRLLALSILDLARGRISPGGRGSARRQHGRRLLRLALLGD